MPPPSALVLWVIRKLGVSRAEAPGVAFVVARAIGRRGTKAVRFMQRGLRKSKPTINKFFSDALKRITRRLKV
jgi:hypothetical protein